MSHGKNKSKICERIQIPFDVDRNGCNNLSDQVAEGFREAIRSGYYQPGDVLPSRAEIAHALGISVRIPREAMAILAAEKRWNSSRLPDSGISKALRTLNANHSNCAWNGLRSSISRT